MEQEKITADFILETLKRAVEEKKAQFNASFWIESALKLNLLLADEHEKLGKLKQMVAQIKMVNLESSNSVASANLKTESTNEYREARSQEMKCKRIEEFIKIAKKMSSIANGGY